MNAEGEIQGFRRTGHDYRQPWFYMITMTTLNRKPLFGVCENNTTIPSKDGRLVYEHWRELPARYPHLDTTTLAIMPDHIHGIVHVKETMPQPLGVPLRAFKSLVTSALRKQYQNPTLQIWNPGYHDWRVMRQGSLKAFTEYIRDNPRRYCLKKAHPDLFVRVETLTHPRLPKDTPWSSYGNLFLLDRPIIVPIRVSRRATPEEINKLKTDILKEVAGGAVIISPFISPGEKEIALAILNMDYGDVILMNPNGFNPCFRPKGKYFDLCAQGRLLILSAFPYTAQQTPLTKELCEQMNTWCKAIAGTGVNA